MFDQLFNRPRGLKRHRTAPLAEERVRYLSHCAEQVTRKSSLRRIAQEEGSGQSFNGFETSG